MATKPRFYIGNVPYSATEQDLRNFFSDYKVSSVRIIMDRETQRPRGFAFVELEGVDIQSVIAALDGQDLMGRGLRISEAREREGGPRSDQPRSNGSRNGTVNENRGGNSRRNSRDDDDSAWKE